MEHFAPTLLTSEQIGLAPLQGYYEREQRQTWEQRLGAAAIMFLVANQHLEFGLAHDNAEAGDAHFDWAEWCFDAVIADPHAAPEDQVEARLLLTHMPLFRKRAQQLPVQPEDKQLLYQNLACLLADLYYTETPTDSTPLDVYRTFLMASVARNYDAADVLLPANYRERRGNYTLGERHDMYLIGKAGLKTPLKIDRGTGATLMASCVTLVHTPKKLQSMVGQNLAGALLAVANEAYDETVSEEDALAINNVTQFITSRIQVGHNRRKRTINFTRRFQQLYAGKLHWMLGVMPGQTRPLQVRSALMGSTRTQVFDKLNRDPETLSPLDIAEKLRPTFLVERILHNETMLRMSPEEQAWDYMELAIASRTNIAQKSHLMDHGIATLQGVVDNAKHRLNSAEQAAAMALAYEPALRRRLLAHTIDPQTIMTVHHNLCNLLARVMPEVNEVSGYRGFSGEIISACLWSNGDPQCFLHLSGPREERASLMGGHFSYNHDFYQLKDRNKWPIQIKNKTLKEGLGHYHDSIIPLRIKRTIAEEVLLYMVARGMISNRDVGRRITSGENLDLAMDATARSLLAIHDGEATEYDKQIVLRARRAAFKKLREQKQKRAQFMPWAKEQTQE